MYDTGGGPMVVPRGIAELPCRLVDPDLFFAESPADVEEAKALCLECPVRAACLAGALKRRERDCGSEAPEGPATEVPGR